MTLMTKRISWYLNDDGWTVAARESEQGDISVQFMIDRYPPRPSSKPLIESLVHP